ncbi:MAG: glycosyltransferase family 39 protein, partial [Pseudomonadota bacterium]
SSSLDILDKKLPVIEGNVMFKQLDPWILAAVFLALAIRLFNLDEAALWLDETLTLQRIRMAWDEAFLHELFSGGDANQLPLYFVLLKAWSTVAGTSPLALRLPSVLLSLVTVILIARLAGILISNQAARWAAWLAAVSPYLLHHAQEARMYPLMSALTAASIYLLARYLRGDSRKLGAAFVLVNLALLATHYYSMFIVSAVLLIPLLLLRRPFKGWLPAIGITGAGVVGVMLMALLIAGRHSGETYDTGFIAFPGVVWSMISGYALMPGSEELHALGVRAALPYLPLALITVIPLGVIAIRGLMALNRDASLLLLVTLAVPLLAPFLVRVIFPDVSINPRYTLPAAPSLLVLLGAGLAQGFSKRVSVKISAFVLIAVMLSGSVRHLSTPGHGREDIYAAGNWLEQHVPVDEEILVTSSEMYHLAIFHWPDRRFRLYPDRKIVVNHQNSAQIAENSPFPPSAGRSIFIFGRAWLSDPNGLLRDEFAKRYAICPGTETRGIRILCLEKPAN